MEISNFFERKATITGGLLLCALLGFSCTRGSPVGTGVDSGDEALARERLVEAHRLYKERQDLNKARLGVALLRQARVADYGNYEATWKLSRFLYYLGTHT